MKTRKLAVSLLLLALWGCGREPEPLEFTYQGTEITINAPAASVLETLGEPKSCTTQPSCAFPGVEETRFYGGFYLTTWAEGDDVTVARVWFADDTAATREGIRIGSTQAQAEDAYPGGWEDGVCTVPGADSQLVIQTENGYVTGICYQTVLD